MPVGSTNCLLHMHHRTLMNTSDMQGDYSEFHVASQSSNEPMASCSTSRSDIGGCYKHEKYTKNIQLGSYTARSNKEYCFVCSNTDRMIRCMLKITRRKMIIQWGRSL